ncbi:baseplate multidomain protein megatron [Pseudogemmobacter sp. W21_MBD1_M6]|uniref:baseplate multidomain protein megatron n=1 Tax=Pseudogemmobacter sp. W21_MBD1_M6 TaxID=3240271 RepID=UPI003F986A44
MATIVLSAVGMAVGGSIGGTVFGLSTAIVGRAVGATLGRVIDQRLMGAGSQVVDTGRVERFRLMGASEGAPVGQIYGRMRVAGQVIWASRFSERVTTSGGGGGGKGAPKSPVVRDYSYSVNLAVALCEGRISRVGRIWADGVEISRAGLNLRVYDGALDQMPDPKMQAVEGAGNVPAYRGTAYVVLEDLELAQFGNRVPQLTFEVMRPAQEGGPVSLSSDIQAVAMMPGTGEYALAVTPVHYSFGPGANRSANVNSPSGESDFATSVGALRDELPNCGSVSLIVSWFGDDLRCGSCTLKPKVEQSLADGVGMPWRVSGVARSAAQEIARQDGRSVYGGTPADAAVIEAIREINDAGQDVVFYPFILMEQLEGNGLTDPYTGASDQAALPWRGRITVSVAAGRDGAVDGSAAAEAEVVTFFGAASASDFQVSAGGVTYSGPAEWSYRRFILHNAALAAAAGGVTAFCIGSEMRGLTQVRGANGGFPAVAALRALAAEVRSLLGAATRIGYAADWTEYFGYQPQDGSGDRLFHLDPLWADVNIDFIGIDNYMPLSDWRDGDAHLDASWGTIHDLGYLKANIAGGEGFDWYYHSPEARAAQIRTPIEDGAHNEPWIYRYKDMRGWWSNPHHERIDGVRQMAATDWVPGSKPIWFTELGCAAINKGTNEPNKFLDPKSSESSLPAFSNGMRDDLIQMQYLRAMFEFWGDPLNNPVSEVYEGKMVDMARAHVWAWDARPYPFFPNNRDLWSDGANYARGHWLNGRTSALALSTVVAEICGRSGVADYDVSKLHGLVRGYVVDDVSSGRAALQPLMLAYGFDAVERDGKLVFSSRTGRASAVLDLDRLALTKEQESTLEAVRAPVAEVAGRVRLSFVDADGDYETRAAEAVFPNETTVTISQSEVPLLMTQGEGRSVTERWLAESRVARDTVRFALPPSALGIGAGDVVELAGDGGPALYRLDHVEQSGVQLIEAVRVEPGIYSPSDAVEEAVAVRPFTPPVPIHPLFLDLPLLTGEEVPHAPHLAVTATPWPGSVAVYSSADDSGYTLNRLVAAGSVIGVTLTPMGAAAPGKVDRGPALRVQVFGGELSSAEWLAVLNGANVSAIGDGSSDRWEVFQFAEAELVAPAIYDLRFRLRGQAGSGAVMPDDWPVGSQFVLLNDRPQQIDLPVSARGLARHYRMGPAQRGLDDPSYVHLVEAFQGIGLRPYAPCHLRGRRNDAGDWQVSWIRRTRIDGDSWQSVDVPLGEESEAYVLRVLAEGSILREVQLVEPVWIYPDALQATDGIAGGFAIEVAQVSARFGAGPFERIELND